MSSQQPTVKQGQFELPILGYPARVWTLLLWLIMGFANLLFAVAFPPNNRPPTVASWSMLAFSLLSAIALLVMAGRTPRWFLWSVLGLAISGTAWLIWEAATPLGDSLFALPYIAYSTYAALWGSRRVAALVLFGIASSYLAVLALKGQLPLMLVGWLLLMTLCVGLVLLIGHLVARLQELATTDLLTGLLNRHGLQSVTGNLGRSAQPRSIVVIDLDDFKAINDQQGHAAGDAVLRSFAETLRAVLRAEDTAVRTGGDEFLLVLPATTEAGAGGLVARLREASPLRWSCGIAQWPHGTTLDSAIAVADALMYQQKAPGSR